jgi:hypothetical protein
MKTLGEFIKGLQRIVENNPKAADLIVLTAIDDEGNGYNTVHFDPSVGTYEDQEWQDCEEMPDDNDEATHICVN